MEYFEGTPIPTSIVPLGILMLAFYGGTLYRVNLLGIEWHAIALLYPRRSSTVSWRAVDMEQPKGDKVLPPVMRPSGNCSPLTCFMSTKIATASSTVVKGSVGDGPAPWAAATTRTGHHPAPATAMAIAGDRHAVT